MNRADGRQQLFAQGAFQEIATGASFERAQHLSVARVRRQHDDSGVGFLCANRLQRTEAVHFRHLQVHQRHVGTMSAELLNRVASVLRFGDEHHVRLVRNQSRDPGAEQRMVVDGENPNSIGIAVHVRGLKTAGSPSKSGRPGTWEAPYGSIADIPTGLHDFSGSLPDRAPERPRTRRTLRRSGSAGTGEFRWQKGSLGR